MSFDILYLEDDPGAQAALQEAVASHNRAAEGRLRRISITPLDDPDKLKAALVQPYDLILADLHFDPRPDRKDEFQLPAIISIVRKWSKDHDHLKPPPIIAYTRREKVDLERVLEQKAHLYEIWDKGSASPDYVAWRLSSMAVDIARSRPDALLERLIRLMPKGAKAWHGLVVEMARKYAAAWSEADQIERAGVSVTVIAGKLGGGPFATKYWPTMVGWEPLGRAISRKTRGHARHVINVFWLGYFMIHHRYLQDTFASAWRSALADRKSNRLALQNVEALEGISEAWFYAGVFHDIANCAQEAHEAEGKAQDLLANFALWQKRTAAPLTATPRLAADADKLLEEMPQVAPHLVEKWQQSLDPDPKKFAPDHGVLAALAITAEIQGGAHGCCAQEAARAMAVHNIIGKLTPASKTFLSWATEPVACLLVVCDQLQAWDRQRGDSALLQKVGPDEAALIDYRIEKVRGHPAVFLGIEYIPPVHLHENPDSFDQVKTELEMVLETRVKIALQRIAEPWPFAFRVDFWLSGQPLGVNISFAGPQGHVDPKPA